MSLDVRELVLPLAHFDTCISLQTSARAAAIYGPSGAGKTSVLEAIAGLRHPRSGSITLNGRPLTSPTTFVPPRLRRIGYVPQDDALFPHLTVGQNVAYGAAAVDAHTLEKLEIAHLVDRRPGALSGGERKRVAIARALLSQPEFLLLDEPLAGVDLPLRGRVLEYLARVLDTFAIRTLLVTHQIAEAEALGAEVFVMERGRVVPVED